MGIIKWYNLKKENNQIKSEINELKLNESKLIKELDKLTNDLEYIKKIAQTKFHMVKPGEKVFRVIDKRKIK